MIHEGEESRTGQLSAGGRGRGGVCFEACRGRDARQTPTWRCGQAFGCKSLDLSWSLKLSDRMRSQVLE